jgi:hypothetical protein
LALAVAEMMRRSTALRAAVALLLLAALAAVNMLIIWYGE